MPTQCRPVSFGFQGCRGRKVTAVFGGGAITSNGGALLLREADHSIGLFDRVAACFTGGRDPRLTEHSVRTLVAQRITGLALGYEDLNDHDFPAPRPAAGAAARQGRGRAEKLRGARGQERAEPPRACAGEREAGTVSQDRPRPRGVPDGAHRPLHRVLAGRLPQSRLVLDMDSTDDAAHGRQEGRFHHGYYGHHCLLPLYVFRGSHPLCAVLRPGNSGPAAGAVEQLDRIVEQVRRRWPGLGILVRADSAYAGEEIMAWCEDNDNDAGYVIGVARNDRLVRKIEPELLAAKVESRGRGRPVRIFAEFDHSTRRSWSRPRRVIAKAEHLPGKSNPRFVVTSLPETISARTVYERVYCPRGNAENAIKEQQLGLFADRTSASPLPANQLRLLFSAFASILMAAPRRALALGCRIGFRRTTEHVKRAGWTKEPRRREAGTTTVQIALNVPLVGKLSNVRRSLDQGPAIVVPVRQEQHLSATQHREDHAPIRKRQGAAHPLRGWGERSPLRPHDALYARRTSRIRGHIGRKDPLPKDLPRSDIRLHVSPTR